MFNELVQLSRNTLSPEKVRTGVFGANMDVSLVNDGPVTINIDSESINIKRKIKRACDENKGKTEADTKKSAQ